MLLTACHTFGQAAYRGGEGDGYAMGSWPGQPTAIPGKTGADLHYTNPVKQTGKLIIQWPGKSTASRNYSIYSVSGLKIDQGRLHPEHGQSKIHTKNWQPGVYIMQIEGLKAPLRFSFIIQ